MSILSRLFGAKAAPEAEPETHAGCRIFAEPIAEGGKFRLAARIEKDIDGETRVHRLIRADTFADRDGAATAAAAKARQVIDEQGDRLFT